MTAPAGLRVGGLTPFTGIDYPGKLSAVVFVQGCPWRCGYCHNPHLQPRGDAAGPPWAEVRAWLRRRVGLIDAVVFSGGEPTIDPALGEAMDEARALGLAVGLHSGGTYPRRLREVLPRADWVGLDVKAPLDDEALHERITGAAGSAAAARESVRAVIESGVAHEIRTTAHPALLDDAALLRLAEGVAARGATHYALQAARPAGGLGAAAADYPAPATLARLQQAFPRFTLRRD
ncbi:MAG: anaerobic ribonucleoside-triphosphate reductase activating protein [Rubrivivax sp.]